MSLIKKNRFWIFIVHVLDMPAVKTLFRIERFNDFILHLNTSFLVMMPNSRPLCVTRVCLSPSFRNMSTTVSIGVWNILWKNLTHPHQDSFTCLVSDCDRRQIHDLPELEGRGPAAHHWDVLREHAQGVPGQRLQPGPRILKSQEQVPSEHESHQILRFSAGK